MNKLKPILLGTVLSLGFAQAQESPFSLAAYWDVRSKATNYVVLTRIGEVKEPFGLKFNLEVDAFAGSDIQGALVGGFSIGKTFPVAQNVDFKFGLAISTQMDKPTGTGLIAGITWRF